MDWKTLTNYLNVVLEWKLWVVPASYVIGGFLVGYVFDTIVIHKLKNWASKTTWRGDDILIGAVKRVGRLWFFFAGLYFALFHIPLSKAQLAGGKKALLVLVLLSTTVVVARITVGFVNMYTDRNREVLPPTSIFRNLTRLAVFALGGLIILQSLGISITPILTALGVGGLAVALALQPTLENLFSGLQIIVSKQLRPGDYVKLDNGEGGYVKDISWRNTTIQALGNNMMVIPNAKLAAATIMNYSQPEKQMSVLVQCGVAYDSDLEKVERVTIAVAKETLKEVDGGVSEFEPFIRYHTFNNSSIDFTVILRGTEFVSQYLLKHEFVKRLKKRFDKEGIEIPFPIRTVYMRNT